MTTTRVMVRYATLARTTRSASEETASRLDITGQAEFTLNEDQYSEEKDVLTRLRRATGILAQEEGKGQPARKPRL